MQLHTRLHARAAGRPHAARLCAGARASRRSVTPMAEFQDTPTQTQTVVPEKEQSKLQVVAPTEHKSKQPVTTPSKKTTAAKGKAKKVPQATNPRNLVFVTSEVAPWSKTGGLGDVLGSLPIALAARGHRVMVVTPRYSNYTEPVDTGVRHQQPPQQQQRQSQHSSGNRSTAAAAS